jgi:hypothetical protein
MRSRYEGPENHRRRPRIIERRVRGRDVQLQLLDQAREAGRLALGELEHQACQRGGVDDRVLERAFEPTSDQPRVKRVVAVLDEDGALCET